MKERIKYKGKTISEMSTKESVGMMASPDSEIHKFMWVESGIIGAKNLSQEQKEHILARVYKDVKALGVEVEETSTKQNKIDKRISDETVLDVINEMDDEEKKQGALEVISNLVDSIDEDNEV